MIEILILIIAVMIGVMVGWQCRELYAMRVVHRMMVEAKIFEEEETINRIPMRLEKHNNVIFAYNDEDNTFMAQGTSLEELDKAITTRFPEKKFRVKEQNLIDIGVNHESV